MSLRNLPPLAAGTAYRVADFERFDLFPPMAGTGPFSEAAILRLHLKNGTRLDVPASDTQLQQLAVLFAEAYGPTVIEHLKERGWV